MNDINDIYLLITLVCIIISILCIRYTMTLSSYLKEFISVSKKVSNKDFSARVAIDAKGELGELTRNINYMICKMEENIQEAEYNHLQVKSILKSISHGILAVDINGNILLINDEAKKIIKAPSNEGIEGRNISLVIKEHKILNTILKFMVSKKNEQCEIEINSDIFYKIKVDPIYLQSSENIIIGSIINIEDITEKVRLENMRSDFVANVSHELKTPLTSISGFVETLRMNENLDVNTRNRFLDIIENESDRLKRLINDILLLSFIENDENKSLQAVNVYEVFKEVEDMAKYIADNKNITLNYKFEDADIKFLSNRDYIKQVFINLIDNAIKYTNEGGEVNVLVYKDKESINIEVKDNGVGIPKEDINRIFERFYRVDKARSRDVGGTGLGLAIVKHILKSVNASVSVESELNIGTKFIVKIPCKNFL